MRGVPANKIGTCVLCSQFFKVRGNLQKYCDDCRQGAQKEARRGYYSNYYRKHPDKVKLANKIARAKRHDHYLQVSRAQQLRARMRWRSKVLESYSGPVPRCACCGESERDFLTIDHVAGNALADLRKLGIPRAGYPLYRWLIRNSFPAGFQVLCSNCNVSKWKHGECVHTARSTNQRFGLPKVETELLKSREPILGIDAAAGFSSPQLQP